MGTFISNTNYIAEATIRSTSKLTKTLKIKHRVLGRILLMVKMEDNINVSIQWQVCPFYY